MIPSVKRYAAHPSQACHGGRRTACRRPPASPRVYRFERAAAGLPQPRQPEQCGIAPRSHAHFPPAY